MNQFLFYHSLKHNKKVREAMMNEAYDIGFLPMQKQFHYGIIEIDPSSRFMSTTTFGNDEKLFKSHLEGNKARDMIFFSFPPVTDELSLDQDPIVNLELGYNSKYMILGTMVIDDLPLLKRAIDAVGLKLDPVNDQHGQVLLADLALIDQFKIKKWLSRGRSDFLAIKYDLKTANEIRVESLFVGSNNSYLKLNRTKKFLSISSVFPHTRGKIERTGKVFGGNVLKLNFYRHDNPFEVEEKMFLPSHTFSVTSKSFIHPRDFNLSKIEAAKLKFWDPESKTHIAFKTDEKYAPNVVGFRSSTYARKVYDEDYQKDKVLFTRFTQRSLINSKT